MNVLVFAPHPDDEVLGCGGTIKKHVLAGDDVYVCVVTRGTMPLFPEESVLQVRSEHKEAMNQLGVKEVSYLDFPAVMLEEQHRYVVNKAIDDVVKKYKPEIVYIPHFGDMQKDHAIVSEAVMVAVRPRGNYTVKTVLAYETLSETEWNVPHASNMFIPNYFIDITNTLDNKLKVLSIFKSQVSEFPNPRSLETIEALAKLRGSNVGVKAAEAFAVIRLIS